jgi:hypothetical protein
MNNFNTLLEQILKEFNVEDRNDPMFYDYIVIFVQQLKARNMLKPGVDVRKTAMEIVKNQYYNYIDVKDNISYKISFFFNTTAKGDTNNLRIEIKNLLKTEPPKVIENTHEEESITEIVNFLDTASREAEQQNNEVPGQDVPAAVGETPAQMPEAQPISPDQLPQTT